MASRGSTLIEFLIYIGIVGAILVAIGAAGLNVLFGKAKLSAALEVHENSRMAMERMLSIARNASAILSPAPGITAGVLSLQVSDASKNPTVFDLSDGAVRIKEGSSPPRYLTGSSTTVTNLDFANVSYPSAPGTVRIALSASTTNQGKRAEYDFSGKYYGTANIRP